MPHRAGCGCHRAGHVSCCNQHGPVYAKLVIDSARGRSREAASNLALRRTSLASLPAPLVLSRHRAGGRAHLVVGTRRLDDRLHHALEALSDLSVVGIGTDVLHKGLDLRCVGVTGLKGLLHLEQRPVMGRMALVGVLAKRPAVFLGAEATRPGSVALVDVVDVDGRQAAQAGTRLSCGRLLPQHGTELAAERPPCLHAAAGQVVQHAQRGAVRHDGLGVLVLVCAAHLRYTYP